MQANGADARGRSARWRPFRKVALLGIASLAAWLLTRLAQSHPEAVERIREATGVPVVMHGGSGISDEDFRKCIQNGVRNLIGDLVWVAFADGFGCKEIFVAGHRQLSFGVC